MKKFIAWFNNDPVLHLPLTIVIVFGILNILLIIVKFFD